MKFSDVPIGAYILIPCPRCGEKKRMKVPACRDLREMRSKICLQCTADDRASIDRAVEPKKRERTRMRDGFRMLGAEE